MTFAQIVAEMRKGGWFLWNLSNAGRQWTARWANYNDNAPGAEDGKGFSKRGNGDTAEAAMLMAAGAILNVPVELDAETKEMLGL